MMSETPRDYDDRSPYLYHYTSAQGLEGILRSRSLWATDAAFLNDWKEINYAAEPLIERMTDLLGARGYDETPGAAPESRSANISWALEAIRRFTQPDYLAHTEHHFTWMDGATYVACLSEDHDQLGQWRAYGKGGYAIGLAKHGLKETAPLLGAVDYGESAVNRLCDMMIEYFERSPTGNASMDGFRDAIDFCMPRLALVKHDAFEQEREWRLVVSRYNTALDGIKVRATPGLVPYVECSFDQSCVAEIVIGPGGDFHSERAVRALLKANDYRPNALRITQSRAPFRG
jgi:hypothetical protein